MLSDFDKDRLTDILSGEGTWFSAMLLRLIAHADKDNRRKIAKVFPEDVALVNEFRGVQE